jgi:hypothetical protein
MFPIGDDNIQGAGPSLSTRGLLVVNVLVFVFEAGLASGALENFITEYGVIPREIMSAVDLHTLLTSMFLHGGWMHLIGNMLFLWVFSTTSGPSSGPRCIWGSTWQGAWPPRWHTSSPILRARSPAWRPEGPSRRSWGPI